MCHLPVSDTGRDHLRVDESYYYGLPSKLKIILYKTHTTAAGPRLPCVSELV